MNNFPSNRKNGEKLMCWLEAPTFGDESIDFIATMIIMIMSRQIVTMELSAESCSFALNALVAVASIRQTIVHGLSSQQRRATTWMTKTANK